MDKKFILYYISIVIFSTVGMFGNFSKEIIFYVALIILGIIHLFYFKVYSYITRLKFSRGLFYSITIGLIMLLVLINFNFIVETQHRATDYFLLVSLGLSLFCAFIYFIIDVSSTKKQKGLSKIRIFFSSFAFYIINYVISFCISFILAGAQALSFG